MTVARDVETRRRHRCTGWINIQGTEFQCTNTFCNEKGRHNGPHHFFGNDDSGIPFRVTWQNGRELAPLVPPAQSEEPT